MFKVKWNHKEGWEAPRIIPFESIEVDPRIEGLHYGVQGFEGMKAYRTKEGKVILFRPLENFKRLLKTTKVLGLPEFDTQELLKCLMKLCLIDREWIP